MSASILPGGGRRERRKQEIHERRLEAARSLFEEKGFAATTVGEICALVEEARKQRGSTIERLAHLFSRAGDESLRAGPRHKQLLIEVVRIIQVEGSVPEQTHRVRAAFRAQYLDEAAQFLGRAISPDDRAA